MWKLDALQQVADTLNETEGLCRLDKIICNHSIRRYLIGLFDNVRQDSFGRKLYCDDIEIRASRGLPNNWLIFVYGERMFGVDPIQQTAEEITL